MVPFGESGEAGVPPGPGPAAAPVPEGLPGGALLLRAQPLVPAKRAEL